MTRLRLLFALAMVIGSPASFGNSADAAVIGCPSGQALQGIDAETGEPVCLPGAGTVAQLIDRDNVVIGQYMGYGVVSREIDGYRVDICCLTTTGEPASTVDPPNFFLYPSADCQGTAYVFVDVGDPRAQNMLFRFGALLNSGDIIFAGDPVTTITPLSFFEVGVGCAPVTEPVENLPVQPVVSVPLSSLGAPPFKVR